MTLRLRNFLTIGMALLAILFCGYGIGFLLGERKGAQDAASIAISPPTVRDEKGPWIKRTLDKFDDELQLTPVQREKVSMVISQTYDEIHESRKNALRKYSTHIIDLHSRLLPHLEDRQKEMVEEQRKHLKEVLDLSFQ